MNVLKRKLPLGAVALLLVLALAAMGLVYGNWTQTLSISGTVSTGSVSAEWIVPINPVCIDNELDKPVAETTQVVKGDGKVLNVTVTNGYPNYEASCIVKFIYTGNIPGVLDEITFDFKGRPGCTVDGPDPVSGDIIATCGNELEVKWNDGFCDQHLPETGPSGGLHVKVLKKALEKEPYQFYMSFKIVQFDKATCGTNTAIS